MRILVFLALLLGAGCASKVDSEASRQFEEANRVFASAQSEAEFLRAAAIYDSILKGGTESGAVLYNLGNAYLRAKRRGLAIAAYRKAERYRPRDPFLDANLAFALGGRAGTERRSTLQHLLFWQDWLSYREVGIAFAIAATLVVLMALGALVFDRRRRVFIRGGCLAGILFLLLGFSAMVDAYDVEVVRHGVVIVPEIVARKGNASSYEPAFTEPLREGAEFVVSDERTGWIRVRLGTGLEGWIPRDRAAVY